MAIRKEFTALQPDYRCRGNAMGVIKSRLDFSKSGFDMDASDVVEALKIPAGFHVLGTSVEVEQEEGGTSTATLGDATDPNGFDNEIDLNTEGVYLSNITDDPYPAAGGKAYSVDDTLDLTLSAHAVDNAILNCNAYGYFYDWIS